uniref:Uncharacterized protein n=1 Tax=Anopheles atroparvus TaxID=41427 RepID=A0AAG5DNM4_ANOAO
MLWMVASTSERWCLVLRGRPGRRRMVLLVVYGVSTALLHRPTDRPRLGNGIGLLVVMMVEVRLLLLLLLLNRYLRVEPLRPGCGRGRGSTAAHHQVVRRCGRVPDVDVLPVRCFIYSSRPGTVPPLQVGHGKAQPVPEAPIVPRDHGAGARQDVHDRVHREHRARDGGDQDDTLAAPRRPDHLEDGLQRHPVLRLGPLELQELDAHEEDQLAGRVRRGVHRVTEEAGRPVHVPVVQAQPVPVVLELLANLTSDQVGVGRTVHEVPVVRLLAVLAALERTQRILAEPHTVASVRPEAHVLPKKQYQRDQQHRQQHAGDDRDQQRQVVDEIVVDDRPLDGRCGDGNHGRPLAITLLHRVRQQLPAGAVEPTEQRLPIRRPIARELSLEPVEQFGHEVAGAVQPIARTSQGQRATNGATRLTVRFGERPEFPRFQPDQLVVAER